MCRRNLIWSICIATIQSLYFFMVQLFISLLSVVLGLGLENYVLAYNNCLCPHKHGWRSQRLSKSQSLSSQARLLLAWFAIKNITCCLLIICSGVTYTNVAVQSCRLQRVSVNLWFADILASVRLSSVVCTKAICWFMTAGSSHLSSFYWQKGEKWFEYKKQENYCNKKVAIN